MGGSRYPCIAGTSARGEVVDRKMRKRTHTRRQRLFIDEKERRVVRRSLADLLRGRDAEEEEKAGRLLLEVGEILRAGNELRDLHLPGRDTLERREHFGRQRRVVGGDRRALANDDVD